jgi:hypothetical protein
MEHLMYNFFYALRDLFPLSWYGRGFQEKLSSLFNALRLCVPTFLNIVTITILIVTVSVVSALYFGSMAWLRSYVEEDQMARTIHISSLTSRDGEIFNDEKLKKLSAIQDVQGNPLTESVHGWNDVALWFYNQKGREDSAGYSEGRTVDIDDLLLTTLPTQSNQETQFAGDGVGQIIVSKTLLRTLGYIEAEKTDKKTQTPEQTNASEEEVSWWHRLLSWLGWRSASEEAVQDQTPTQLLNYPEQMMIKYAEDEETGQALKAPVNIVGVMETTYNANLFFVTEDFYRALQDQQWDPIPRYQRLNFGPLTAIEQTKQSIEQPNAQNFLTMWGLQAVVKNRAGTEQWLTVDLSEGGKDEQQWQDLLSYFLEPIQTANPNAGFEFTRRLEPNFKQRESLEKRYVNATVYVKRLEEVPAVVDKIEAQGYWVTNDAEALARMFLQISSFGGGILGGIALIVAALSAISIGLSILQSIQRKIPEIAILKAFGSSNRKILFIYNLEVFVLWLIALLIGGAISFQIADFVNQQILALFEVQSLVSDGAQLQLVALSPQLFLIISLIAWLLVTVVALLASRAALRLNPAHALSMHR